MLFRSKTINRFPASEHIQRLRPDGVILSHWDLDHILGCTYADPGAFEKTWIAPEYMTTLSAYRVARYVQIVGNLCLVPTATAPRHLATATARNYQARLYQGANSGERMTLTNQCGLLLEIKATINANESVNVLLTGDVPYNSMPDELVNGTTLYNYIHIPHHCRRMDRTRFGINVAPNAQAIISEYLSKVYPDHYNAVCGAFTTTTLTTAPAAVRMRNARASTHAVSIIF